MNLARRIWRHYRPFQRQIAVIFGFIAALEALSVVAPWIWSELIDNIVTQGPIATSWWLLAAAAMIWTLNEVFIFNWRTRYEIRNTDYAIPRAITRFTIERVLGFSIGQHISHHSGLKSNIINRGRHAMTSLVMVVLYQILPLLASLLFIVTILLYLNWGIGLTLIAGVVAFSGISAGINARFKKPLQEMEKRRNRDGTFRDEVLRNAPVIIANGVEHKAVEECNASMASVDAEDAAMWEEYLRIARWRDFVRPLTLTTIVALGIHAVYSGTMTPGYLVGSLSWSVNALGRVRSIAHLQRQIMRMWGSIREYFDMLDIPTDIAMPENPRMPAKFAGEITFENVSFRYRRRDADADEETREERFALRNVSCTIEAGETVALVGASGSGKTTFVNVLQRMQDPDEGSILIDGINLREINLHAYRQALGLVEQQVFLFDRTIEENIRVGLNDRISTTHDLQDAVQRARLEDLVEELPDGFATIIGERGIKLSGGERQRVGIARALIKTPRILILDEATSNLDPENEALIRDAINDIANDRTTIIIAHRLSTVRHADRLVVMEKGRIVATGQHEELIKTCGPYRRLVRHQMNKLDE